MRAPKQTHSVFVFILTILLLPVHAQLANSPIPNPTGPVASPRPSATTTPTATVTAGNTTNTNATYTPASMPPCNAGPGQFIVDSPLPNTFAEVAEPLNISWHYSTFTNTQRFPAKKISIYYQNADDSATDPTTPWTLAIDNLTRTATNVTWIVPQTIDGDYLVRLVADDFDLLQNPSLGCYPDTFPAASSSQRFHIVSSAPLQSFPDTMGPSNEAVERFGRRRRRRSRNPAAAGSGILPAAGGSGILDPTLVAVSIIGVIIGFLLC